ncbi:MAG: transporter substrate-binding protein [Acidimicrobiia bacterium]|nr:transporter substrate-binding protein [Acidimicrobiia bacterium]
MNKLMLTSMWKRKRRLVGAGIAVVIGVAFLAATLVLGDAMKKGINSVFVEAYSGTDVSVRSAMKVGSTGTGQRGTLDAALVERMATVPGVATAQLNIDGVAQVVGTDGDAIGGNGPPTLGSNWRDDPRNPYRVTEGRAPHGPFEVMIDHDTAKAGKLHVGDHTTVRLPQPISVTVVGIAELPSGKGLGGATFTWFDTESAARYFLGAPGRVSSIDLTARPGVSPEKLRTALTAVLPAGTEALTGTQLVKEQNRVINDNFLGFFTTFLLAFAGVAVLVGAFSIHNTFSIMAAQRSRESALLRAIGASRRQILTSVALEALLVGVVASGGGLLAGIGLAHGLQALLDALNLDFPTAGIAASAGTVEVCVLVGTGVALLASLAPAIKASRVSPLAALRDVAIDRSGTSRRRAVIGALVAAAGVIRVLTATSSNHGAAARAALGSLLLLVGVVMLGPVVARVAAGVIGAPIATVRGTSGKLARRNAMRNPSRTASTASALMIGTAVVALFATLGASISASLDSVVKRSFSGDLVVALRNSSGPGIDPQFAAQVRALPLVTTAAELVNAPLRLNGKDTAVTATNPADMASMTDLDVRQGSLSSMTATGLAVSKNYAEDHHWQLGTSVPAMFADGTTSTFTVQAIYAVGSLVGDLVITDAAWSPHANQASDVAVLIDLKPGVTVEQGRAAVAPLAQHFGTPDVQDRHQYVKSTADGVNQILGLVYGLLGLAVLIALLGIANTLSLSIFERTRELGLLRAVGQSRRALRSTIRWESVIIALFGTVGGLGLGTFFGWGLVRAIDAQTGIGTFSPPITALVVVLGAASVAGVIAAVRPARRAARLNILDAIATS